MRILHLPFTYFPDPPGGTEVYVAGLARHLDEFGIESVIAAPSDKDQDEQYEILGHAVRRFRVPPPLDLREMYGAGSPKAAAELRTIIESAQPDIVHMHAHTRASSAIVAREVRELGLPLVFTYHTPTASCQRGTLMRYGKIPCDGRILVTRCSACVAQQQGAGLVSWVLAMVPPMVGKLVGALGLTGRGWAGLRLTELLTQRKRNFQDLMNLSTVVVAVSSWVEEVLVRNGVSRRKIVLNRQGTETGTIEPPISGMRGSAPLRTVMLGRISPEKGLDTVLDAFDLLPDLSIELDIYGVDHDSLQGGFSRLRSRIEGDRRIRLLPPFDVGSAVEVIRSYDLTLVPSRWLETGPLVVLESFAAGVPVLGSNLGGIAERIIDGVDGLLLPPTDPAAWAAALERLLADQGMLQRLRAGITPPRTMRHVAEEMREVYQRVAIRPRGAMPLPGPGRQ